MGNLPAFLAARRRSSSMRCWAGSPSGNFSMKLSTWETTSWLVKYWYKPSDDRTNSWSLGQSLWWRREGEHDKYGAVPIYSLRNISNSASFNLGCTNRHIRISGNSQCFKHQYFSNWCYHRFSKDTPIIWWKALYHVYSPTIPNQDYILTFTP